MLTGILALVLGACSGGALSVSDYVAALDDATVAYTAESQALSATFHQTVEEEIAALADAGEGDLLSLATGITARETVQYLALLEDAMMRYADALMSMKPPVALTEPHDGYIEAIDSVRISMPATRERVGEAHDLDGIQSAILGSGFSDGQFRLRASCVALEAAVRGEGRGVDLACPGESTEG